MDNENKKKDVVEENIPPEELPKTDETKEESVSEEVVEDVNEKSETDLLIEENEKLKAEVASLRNSYARAYADTENMKKRLQAEADNIRKYRAQGFALEILPVIDNLERALKQDVPEEAKAIQKGVEMTFNQLVEALKKEGVVEIDCLNKQFDPNFHQAIMTEKKDGVEPGIVIEVFQKGYKLKDRILRASMVKVSE
ncbi:MAG: nucleotide exchange factor GrpE [Erysipelotrichaceae bacterium]|nr:nucleotide exchange factor GrpE [Erysipelotrichaceae bacterium]